MKKIRREELKKIVADSYELTAVQFDSTRSKIAAADFQWAANQIGTDDEIFDAGCGNGRLLDYLSNDFGQYLGFDQSEHLISLAQQRHPNYQFLVGDLSDLSILPSDRFSIIFCSAVISHLPGRRERRQLLKSFLRLSRSHGRLIINVWKLEGRYRRKLWRIWWLKLTGRHPYGWRDLIFPWKNSEGNTVSPRYYHAFTRRGFRREIRQSGWQIESVRDDRFNYWLIAKKNS